MNIQCCSSRLIYLFTFRKIILHGHHSFIVSSLPLLDRQLSYSKFTAIDINFIPRGSNDKGFWPYYPFPVRYDWPKIYIAWVGAKMIIAGRDLEGVKFTLRTPSPVPIFSPSEMALRNVEYFAGAYPPGQIIRTASGPALQN
jgi:hypothetical protein